MKARTMIAEAVKWLDSDKEVFITIYTRDANGHGVGKDKYPLADAFSHGKCVSLICEESQGERRHV